MSNYIQIELGGKLRGLKFSNYALEKIVDTNGEGSGTEAMYAVVYGGLMGYSHANREPVDYTFGDVVDRVDEIVTSEGGDKVIADVMAAMTESQNYKNMVERNADKFRSVTPEKKKEGQTDLEYERCQTYVFAGVIGWTLFEYHTASPYEFFIGCEAYFVKREIEDRSLRMGFYRLHQSLVEKPLRIEDFWPLFGEKQQASGAIAMTKEQWNKIKTIHG